MFQIRPGVREDCRAIEAMIRELAVYEKMPDGPRLDHKQLEADGFDRSGDPLFGTFVAQLADSEELIGYCLYFYKYSTWEGKGLWLEDLYVKPEHRGSGAGYALIRAVAQQTVDEGCDRLEWNCLDWNHSSIRFYKKLNAINLTELEGWNTWRLTGSQCRQLGQSSPK